MKRLLTAGIFGTILGIFGTGTANASIVSSGFLDEKLTEYALSTSLDLKANQSDLTALSNKIGTLPSGKLPTFSGYEFLFPDLNQPLTYPTSLTELISAIYGNSNTREVGLLAGFITGFGFDFNADGRPETPIGLIPNHNLAEHAEKLAIENTGKIGDLPSAILPSIWTDIPYYTETGVNMPEPGFPLPPTLGEQLNLLFNGGIDSPIDRMFRVMTLAGAGIAVGTMDPGTNDPQAEFLGLNPLTQKVRSIEENITLPSGAIPQSKGFTVLLPEPTNSTYPTSIRNFMTDIYSGYWSISNLADAVYFGNEYTGQKEPALVVKGLRQITDEIGTLPSGNFPLRPGYDVIFSGLNQPLTYPTSLAELITAIYGNSETNSQGLLSAITTGFPFNMYQDGRPDDTIGLIPNFILAQKAMHLANVNSDKIGVLPTEYATVGAALTAIKGIAEDAKAAALAAIPDPKQEGSSGKFVLTVDIIGDNATYHWEKIDREGETSTTTTE